PATRTGPSPRLVLTYVRRVINDTLRERFEQSVPPRARIVSAFYGTDVSLLAKVLRDGIAGCDDNDDSDAADAKRPADSRPWLCAHVSGAYVPQLICAQVDHAVVHANGMQPLKPWCGVHVVLVHADQSALNRPTDSAGSQGDSVHVLRAGARCL